MVVESSHVSTPRIERREFLVAGATMAALSGCLTSGRGTTSTGTPSADASLSGEISIAGSSTVYPLTLEVADRFSSAHPDVSISVSSTGSGSGFADFFCIGRTELNDASRPIQPDEHDQCAAAGVDYLEFRVATDALTVVANDGADWLRCLTPNALARIWGSTAASWSDVDPEWPDEPIELYGPTSASGTYDYFSEAIIGDAGEHRSDYAGTEQDSTIIEGVSRSEYAMGYLGFAYYTQNSDAVRAVAIDDGAGCVVPSLETAKDGSYRTLSRPLFIYVARDSLERPEVRAFCRFYLERTTSALVRNIGYVPVTADQMNESLARLERAVEDGS